MTGKIKVEVKYVESKRAGGLCFVSVDFGDGKPHVKGPMREEDALKFVQDLQVGQPPGAVTKVLAHEERKADLAMGYTVLALVGLILAMGFVCVIAGVLMS